MNHTVAAVVVVMVSIDRVKSACTVSSKVLAIV